MATTNITNLVTNTDITNFLRDLDTTNDITTNKIDSFITIAAHEVQADTNTNSTTDASMLQSLVKGAVILKVAMWITVIDPYSVTSDNVKINSWNYGSFEEQYTKQIDRIRKEQEITGIVASAPEVGYTEY